jgi:two-component system sensor histidine kinase PilS (NtrC family)
MPADLPQNDAPDIRLQQLMFLRVLIVTFLLGIAAFIQIQGANTLPAPPVSPLYSIIIITYLLSFVYLLLHKQIKSLEINVYIQAACDVTLITALVYATGGIGSIYSVFYPLVIIYSTLFLKKRGGMLVASAASLPYGLLLDLEYYGIIHPIYDISWNYTFSAGYVFSRIFIHIVSFYIVALLITFVVEREKKLRSLLEEKKSEFYRLDRLHQSIIESVDTGIMTIDPSGTIKSFNRAAEKITGFLFPEVANKGIETIFPGFPPIEDKIKRSEMMIPGKNNKNIILGFSVSPLMGGRNNPIGNILLFQDLTATKEMEKEVERNKQLAIIGEMAAGLAHEIRNPLASLGGSIQMLKKNLTQNLNPNFKTDETNERLMQIILRGRDQLENVVKNFLLLARPNRINYEKININGLMDDVVESLRCSADWHDTIKMERVFCKAAEISGNKTELKQLFWNLLLNAVQSMPDGGKLTLGTEFIASDNGTDYLEIRISDTGCGIEKNSAAKIFNPFYTTKEKGTGLGLAIANRIVKSHSGEIKISGELNQGTSFIILLPKCAES